MECVPAAIHPNGDNLKFKHHHLVTISLGPKVIFTPLPPPAKKKAKEEGAGDGNPATTKLAKYPFFTERISFHSSAAHLLTFVGPFRGLVA